MKTSEKLGMLRNMQIQLEEMYGKLRLLSEDGQFGFDNDLERSAIDDTGEAIEHALEALDLLDLKRHKPKCSCSECGMTVKPEWKGCPHCENGRKRVEGEKDLTEQCSICGRMINPLWLICPGCKKMI